MDRGFASTPRHSPRQFVAANEALASSRGLDTRSSTKEPLVRVRAKNPRDRNAGGSSLPQSLRVTFVATLLALVIGFAAWSISRLMDLSSPEQLLQNVIRPLYWELVSSISFWWSPIVLIVIPLLLVTSIAFPADPSQAVLSRGFFQDVAWSVTRTTLTVLLLSAYGVFLTELFNAHFQWLVFEAPNLPVFWRTLILFLFADFLYWLRHVALHKVPAFWNFHAIHHSQRELNPFTTGRIHPGELIISLSIWLVPMLAITRSLDVVLGYYVLRHSYDAFIHTNIRTNLGLLRFILVTPQSHRVHHSADPEHHDTNFGAMLSVWDYLFRTQHRNCDVYPPTGISDADFPNETAKGRFLTTLAEQFLYPFQALARRDTAAVIQSKLG